MRPPRVLHVAPNLFGFDGVLGGGERYPLELARAMSARVPTRLVAFGSRRWEGRDGELRISVLPNWVHVRRFRFDPVNPLLLLDLARADVIHAHQTPTLMAGFALLYARAAGKPIFTTYLGGDGLGLQRLTDVTGWYTGHLHISAFSRRACGHDGRPNARVILGGVDARRFRPDPAARRTNEALYVGRLLPHKGIDHLIRAAGPATPLRIVGRPWRHARGYYDLLRRLADGKPVTFAEDYDDDALVRAYQRALCVVLPSVHTGPGGEHYAVTELLGQTLLEGMACGAPAVCTAVASLPEVVADGATGFVVPPNDPAALAQKLAWLAAHPDETRAMGEAARRRALGVFSWDAVVDRCLAAYGAALAPQRPAAGLVPAG